MRSVNAVGHSACAVAAAGGQRQLFTIDHGSVAGDGQRLLIVLFCQGDVQRDGEILIIVAGRLEGEGDLVARLAAGNRVGQQTAIRCEILLGKCDIRAGADAVFTVIAPRLSAGKPRPVWFVGMHGGVRVLLRQLDRFEAAAIRRSDGHVNGDVEHFAIGLIVGLEISIEASGTQLIQHRLRFLPAPCAGCISLRIGQSDLAEFLAVFGCQAGGFRAGRYRLHYPKLHTIRGERLVVLRLAKLCVHIVAGSGTQRVRLNVLPLCAAAVGIGGVIVVGHLSLRVTRPVCQAWRAGRLAVNVEFHADLAVLLGLVDLDRCGAGCFRIGIPILRRELPSDIMTKRVRIQNRIVRQLPRERPFNRCAGGGILHRARNPALAQRLTVGDFACGDVAIRLGRDPVHRVEDERQSKVLVVGGGDRHRGGADLAGRCSLFRIETYQSQLAPLKFRYLRVDIISMSGEVDSSLPIPQIVAHGAVISMGRGGQQLLEVIGVRPLRAVDHIQCAMLDIRGCGSLIDGEVPAYRRDDVVAAFNILDGHPAGTGVGVVGILCRVFSLRNDRISVLEGHGRLQRIAGVGAGCDFHRGRHGFWRDLPLDHGRAGVVAGTFDGQGDAVADIGGRAAAFDNIGDSCFIPVLQRHAGDLRRLLRRVVLEAGSFQRDGCALDGLGGDGDFHDAGCGCVNAAVGFVRGECPIEVHIAGVNGSVVFILPREGARDRFSCGGVLHRALNGERAVFQCLAVDDTRRADFEVI